MKSVIATLAALVFAAPALAQEARLPSIPVERYNEAQKKAAAEFEGPPREPFLTLMYSSELVTPMRVMGGYLRRRTAIGPALSELAILVTAREWSQDYEWRAHSVLAVQAGISQEIVNSIAGGRRPAKMTLDEEIVYDFSIELHNNKSVSDATYFRTKDRFAERGVVDLVAVNGYYTMVAMVLNMARVPVSGGRNSPAFQINAVTNGPRN